tara:strand:- start:1802 stop:2044 length:243 start_codon:yes stop_codon:yes gene_type:complete
MSQKKKQVEYTVHIPIHHKVHIVRDENLTQEQVWKSVTKEELLGSIFVDELEDELVDMWRRNHSEEVMVTPHKNILEKVA